MPTAQAKYPLLYRGMKLTVGTVMQAAYRPKVEGLEHVPTTGPAILAGNHVSFSDHFFVPLVVPRKVVYLAKADYFNGKGVAGRLTAGFFNSVGQKPVDRSSGRAGLAAIQTGVDVLAAGDLLGIYPEGTRSPDGKLYRGRVGVARLWLESKAPLLPCAVIGTDVIQPPGKKMPKVAPVAVRFGPAAGPVALRRRQARRGPVPPGHRRHHAGDPGAVRPGVRERVRDDGQRVPATAPRSTRARRLAGRAPKADRDPVHHAPARGRVAARADGGGRPRDVRGEVPRGRAGPQGPRGGDRVRRARPDARSAGAGPRARRPRPGARARRAGRGGPGPPAPQRRPQPRDRLPARVAGLRPGVRSAATARWPGGCCGSTRSCRTSTAPGGTRTCCTGTASSS